MKEHLVANNPTFNNLPEDKQMEMIATEMNNQAKASLQGTYTANLNSKFKDNFDKIFTDTEFKKDEESYNTGLMSNFKFTTRDGKVISGQQLANQIKEGKYGKDVVASYKGSVDDYTSPLPYGSTVFSLGNDEIYMEPDVNATNSNEALLNGVYRSMINAEIGNISNFKYKGSEFTSMYKPDGSVVITDKATNTSSIYNPVFNETNQFVGLKQVK